MSRSRLSSLILRSWSQESTDSYYSSAVPKTPSEINFHFVTEGTTQEKDFPKSSDPKRGEVCEGRSRSNSNRVSPIDENSVSKTELSSKAKKNATPPYLPSSGSWRKIVWLLGEEVMQNQQRAWS